MPETDDDLRATLRDIAARLDAIDARLDARWRCAGCGVPLSTGGYTADPATGRRECHGCLRKRVWEGPR